MKLKTVLACLMFFTGIIYSQVEYKKFYSSKLGEDRELKIRLPDGYDNLDKINYPLIIVFDGDYLFQPVAGNIDYQTYWNEMPECIVVGVNQSKTRLIDFELSYETHMPSQNGATFFEFVSMELLPYIQENYRVSNFRTIVGHDLGANFINYYLFKEAPLFDSYVVLSPDYANKIPERLSSRLTSLEKDIYYYLATSDGDIGYLRSTILNTDSKLKSIDNPHLFYKFNDFADSNHYTLVGQAIPEALNEIFKLYKPISKKEYKEDLLEFDGSPFEYLEKKYDVIFKSYGIEKRVVENDLRAIASACQKKEDKDSLLKLAKLAKKTYPESMIGAYYFGMYYENVGNYKRALQSYQSGVALTPSQFIDKDVLYDKIEIIKAEYF
ncbi:alpha/beta hydrolase [Cognatitamlana onchidii]|uniref:alpha/beta hydrolase n=1 Tax=Cognatitamlana onchidii TaxID=2562860 RepID=UPI0010A67512|nr:alpha/beta hydrolase-fold protein [Algibacter onchidii]